GALKIGLLVRGSDNRAQARLAFGDGGVTDGQRQETGIAQRLRELVGAGGVADHDGRDGRLALAGIEAELLEAALEELGVAPELLDEALARVGIEQGEGGLASCDDRGRMGGGKDERPGAMIEELDQLARTADVASERADGFAERADLDVHAAMAAEMIDGTAAAAAEDAGGVGVVDHHDAVEFLGEVAELRQRGDVAFHGKDAVGDQELLAGP